MVQKVRNRIKAFGYAIQGVHTFFKEGIHARIQALAAIMVVLAGGYFNVTFIEWAVLLLCVGLVLGLEAMNSAIEYLTDLVSPAHHKLAKKAKDVAAASVLIAALFSFIIALFIFVPKLLWQ